MRTRSFGTTDLRCSEIGFGTWALASNWSGTVTSGEGVQPPARDRPRRHVLRHRNVYGKGANEEIVATALEDVPRESVQISTKFGYALEGGRQEHSQGERPRTGPPPTCAARLEAQPAATPHRPRGPLPAPQPAHGRDREDDLFEELDRLRDEGKLRHYGVALGPAIGWRDEGLRAHKGAHVTALQTVYNVLEQHPGRTSSRRRAQRGGVMARVPTSSGLLEDKYTLETTSPNDHRSHRPREWLVEGLQKGRTTALPLPRSTGSRWRRRALKFILAQDAIACVLPTVTNEDDLEEWAAASDAPTSRAEDLDPASAASTSATSTSSRSPSAPSETPRAGRGRCPACPAGPPPGGRCRSKATSRSATRTRSSASTSSEVQNFACRLPAPWWYRRSPYRPPIRKWKLRRLLR